MPHTINVALQILPIGEKDAITIIDKAIAVIQESGLLYVVCPFETVIEGEYDAVMTLVKKVQEVCMEAGVIELIANLKIHQLAGKSAHITDKMGKYQLDAFSTK
jgi:uncharacterized protein YqgV (UPF0045/DUF77 family)